MRGRRLAALRGAGAGEAAEYGARHEAGAAEVVLVEDAADDLAGGIKPRDGAVARILHLAIAVDAQAAEREGDAAGDDEAGVRRLVDRQRPVRLRRRDALGRHAVEDRR